MILDFYKFSKEEVISRLIEEVNKDANADQTIATTDNSKTVSSEPITIIDNLETELENPIAIEKYQKQDSNGSKEPLKNHPSL